VFTCATDAVKWLETQVPFKIVGWHPRINLL
jgi:hypothetical protein